MLEDLTLDTFSGREGEMFRLRLGPEQGLDLVLIEARGLRGGGEGREPFSLVFRGPAEPVLGQQIRALGHPDLGVLEIFLVPIGPDAEGMQYEAVFA